MLFKIRFCTFRCRLLVWLEFILFKISFCSQNAVNYFKSLFNFSEEKIVCSLQPFFHVFDIIVSAAQIHHTVTVIWPWSSPNFHYFPEHSQVKFCCYRKQNTNCSDWTIEFFEGKIFYYSIYRQASIGCQLIYSINNCVISFI